MLLIVAVTDKKMKIMKAYSVSVQNILRLFPHKARQTRNTHLTKFLIRL